MPETIRDGLRHGVKGSCVCLAHSSDSQRHFCCTALLQKDRQEKRLSIIGNQRGPVCLPANPRRSARTARRSFQRKHPYAARAEVNWRLLMPGLLPHTYPPRSSSPMTGQRTRRPGRSINHTLSRRARAILTPIRPRPPIPHRRQQPGQPRSQRSILPRGSPARQGTTPPSQRLPQCAAPGCCS